MSPTNEKLLRQLVERLGGEGEVLDQLSAMLEKTDCSDGSLAVTEDTDGYCYLRLFDRIEHRDAKELGPRPTVAALRRFSNGRADPFGTRPVVGAVRMDGAERVCHVDYNGSACGLRPVALLAALAKDLTVGGIPDGPTSDFPPSWIPAKLEAYQCWDYIPGNGKRNLDFLAWVGELRDEYELVSAESSRIRWSIRASPVGPDTANVDIVPPNSKTLTVKAWESNVAHTRYHQDWAVRGDRVFVEVYVWRAAKFTTTPGAPLPTPGPGRGEHGDLLMSQGGRQAVIVGSEGVHHRQGRCYVQALSPCVAHAEALLRDNPRVDDMLRVLASAKTLSGHVGCVFTDGFELVRVAPGWYHVQHGSMSGEELLRSISALAPSDRVGSTQAEAVQTSGLENVAAPAQLTIRPKSTGITINVLFATKITPESPILYWDLTAGKKLGVLLAYFESAELVSLSMKVTVHKGDGDTIFHLAADTESEPFKSDMDWIGAAHTLQVSGNVQSATSGEMVLKGAHGFGTQLRGAVLGNATPIIQGWLETTVTANVLIKAMLEVRVAGTGSPKYVVLPARRATGNMVNHVDDEESDEEPPAKHSSNGKAPVR
jgi:hypothetical protein